MVDCAANVASVQTSVKRLKTNFVHCLPSGRSGMHAADTEFKGWAGSLNLGYFGFGEAVSYLMEMLMLFNAEMATKMWILLSWYYRPERKW